MKSFLSREKAVKKEKVKYFCMGLVFCRSLFLLFLIISCSKPVYKIGFIGTLSGHGASLGVNGRNGALLYFGDLNERGGINGRKIEMLTYDCKSDYREAERGVEELYDKGVKLIIGHMTSGEAVNAVKKADELKIPIISASISSNEYSNIDDYLIRITSSNEMQGIKLAEHALSRKIKSASIVYDSRNNIFTRPIINSFSETFEEDGVILGVHKIGNDDFFELEKTVLNIISENPDAVLALNDAIVNAKISQYLRIHGSNSLIIMSTWSLMGALIENGGDSVEGSVHASLYRIDMEEPTYADFKNKYNEKYNEFPNFSGLFGYESAMFVSEILKKSGSRRDIMKTIKGIDVFKGIQQDIYLGYYKDGIRDITLYEIKNGAFVRVYE